MAAWVAGLFGNLFGGIGQVVSDQRTNRTNREIQDSVNEANRQMQESANETNRWAVEHTNRTNREIQDSINAQNLALQHEAWNREDNAVQRRTADLKAAGMNPILAAGGAAQASGPIKLDAPHAEAPQAKAAQMQAVRMQRLQFETDMIERALRMRDDFATNAKQRELLEAMAGEHKAKGDQIRQDTDFGRDSYDTRLDILRAQLKQDGERTTLIQLQQENQRLHNKYAPDVNRSVVLRNIEQAINNEFARELNRAGLNETQKKVLILELERQTLARDFKFYTRLGLPASARGTEVNIAYILHEKADRAKQKVIDLIDVIGNTKFGRLIKEGWDAVTRPWR